MAGMRRGTEERDGRVMMNSKAAPMAPMDALARQREVFEKGKDGTRAAAEAGAKADVGEMANALSGVSDRLKNAEKPQAVAASSPASVSPAKAKAFQEQLRQAGEALAVEKGLASSFAAARKSAGFGGGAARGEEAVELAKAVEQAQSEAIKQVGARTFYNRGGVWVDSTAKTDAKPTVVKTFSQEYFDLLKADSTLGAVLALGGNILVMVKDTLYQIEE